MYAFNSRTILSVLYSQIRLKHLRRKQVNPGIQKRLKIADTDVEEFEDDDDLNYELNVDDSTNTGLTRKQEVYQQKERLKMLIVRQKYFNETYPNFLTWQEKEQIRFLHKTDPEEWSVEKLSDSFPALPNTIKKIIISQWKPKSEQRINNHNKNVNENWLKLKNNQIDIDEELKNHLTKFMDRKTVDTILESILNNPPDLEHKQLPMKTEFQDIVKSTKFSLPQIEIKSEADTNMILSVPKMVKNEHITLESLKNITGKQNLLKEVKEKVPEVNSSITKLGNQFSKLTVNIASENIIEPQQGYAEVIEIPKKYWVKGKTYRVSDCYYDDDGEFLYRVPGMKKNS